MRAAAHLVAFAGPLDLDDARAEIGEEARAVRAGEDAGQIEDDEAVERERVVTHRRSIAGGTARSRARYRVGGAGRAVAGSACSAAWMRSAAHDHSTGSTPSEITRKLRVRSL